jgi:sterol desaturase/sphingolipid hydroxylase (fatty acid hydroxylase superfamily)
MNGTLAAEWVASSPMAERLSIWLGNLISLAFLTGICEPSPGVVALAVAFLAADGNSWWRPLADLCETEEKLFLVGIPVVMFCVYWINGGVILFFEACRGRSEAPGWMANLHTTKIQQRKPFEWTKMWKIFVNVTFNLVVLTPICCYGFILAGRFGWCQIDREGPAPHRLVVGAQLATFSMVNEVIFFYGHWLCHAVTPLYIAVHKQHHEFPAPNALAALYCHPVEFILLDILPLSAGFVLFGCHFSTLLAWVVACMMGTQTHHCGHRWPWIMGSSHQPDFHDYHHERFHCNYGNVGLFDWIHGTLGRQRFPEHAARRAAAIKARQPIASGAGCAASAAAPLAAGGDGASTPRRSKRLSAKSR